MSEQALTTEEVEAMDNHTLLEKLAQKAIDHSKSGRYVDYSDSLKCFFEAKHRMTKKINE